MLIATRVEIVQIYEVHCEICGCAVENDERGGFQFTHRSDAERARREHIGDHRDEEHAPRRRH